MSTLSEKYKVNGTNFMVLQHQPGHKHKFPGGKYTFPYRPDGWHNVWNDLKNLQVGDWIIAVANWKPASSGDDSNYLVSEFYHAEQSYALSVNAVLMRQMQQRALLSMNANDDPRFWAWQYEFCDKEALIGQKLLDVLAIAETSPDKNLQRYAQEADLQLQKRGVV